MRQYFCECRQCGDKHRIIIKQKPYPEEGEIFVAQCPKCNKDTGHVRVDPTNK